MKYENVQDIPPVEMALPEHKDVIEQNEEKIQWWIKQYRNAFNAAKAHAAEAKKQFFDSIAGVVKDIDRDRVPYSYWGRSTVSMDDETTVTRYTKSVDKDFYLIRKVIVNDNNLACGHGVHAEALNRIRDELVAEGGNDFDFFEERIEIKLEPIVEYAQREFVKAFSEKQNAGSYQFKVEFLKILNAYDRGPGVHRFRFSAYFDVPDAPKK
ncbi:MAG: hypothetical protein NBV63_02260 [Candidatus Pacebacteria bacterium]|nr:hypothetical protein [Candidatus Paceibacterota bacterium]